MFDLGCCYDRGLGVEKDYQQAFHWYNKAADAGHAGAFHWYSKAAEAGISFAMRNLGCCYHHGLGVEKDYQQAFHWYSKAAEADDEEAMFYIGNWYEHGYGVPKDLYQAIKWYDKAKNAGFSKAAEGIEDCKRRLGLLDAETKVSSFGPSSTTGQTNPFSGSLPTSTL
ncbi:hypothetical protein P9112_006170 [Eukaryota sp. TZLM1-RC]